MALGSLPKTNNFSSKYTSFGSVKPGWGLYWSS